MGIHLVKRRHKSSLKKFKGDDIHARDNENVNIKLEPAYLAENENILLAAGYVKNNTFYDRRQREGQCRYESPRNINSKNSGRKMNPLGKDGRALTCKHVVPSVTCCNESARGSVLGE